MSALGVVAAAVCVACFLGYGKIVLNPRYDHNLWLGVLAFVFFITALIMAGVVGMNIDEGVWARLNGDTT